MSEEAGEDEDASPEEMGDGKNDGPSTSRGSWNSGPGEAVDPVASSGRKRHQDITAGKGNANLGAGGNQGDAAVKVEEEEVEEEQEEVEEEGAEAAGREQEGEEVYFDESEFKDGKAEQFNDAFFSVDNLTFFYLLKTANFLDIPSMVNVGCKRLARKLTGKTLLGMIEAMKIQDHERPARAERQEDTGTGQH
ncbi:uncharacterized protein LOC143286619 [Babylonia areolata]|uniref:uncharacterized protein LOC143286619 n=1 Tax=Babylonia areolata TaxID=304850 RepID=UPI003FD4800B